MRVFKSKWFARFARKNRIDDEALKSAVVEIEAGNFDADLGGCVYKQRVARKGQGKRGGYRTIMLFKQGERAFFVYGFAKNKLDNITDDDLAVFREIAEKRLSENDEQIRKHIENGALTEIV
jgi:hypothetical protein